jgi:hypothetical protein
MHFLLQLVPGKVKINGQMDHATINTVCGDKVSHVSSHDY